MSTFLIASPEALAAASADLRGIGEAIRAATGSAAPATTRIAAAAADEVSAAIASVFGAHGSAYQALSAQAAVFQEQFVQALTAGAGSYAAAEAASVSPLQALEQTLLGVANAPLGVVTARLDALNAPTLALTGRPLIGNGANGA